MAKQPEVSEIEGLAFAKYQALGNDFVLIDARNRPELADHSEFAHLLLDRQRGIGGDDLILLGEAPAADAGMRILTPSGGRLTMCGNGIRCLGRFARDLGLWQGERLRVCTEAGPRDLTWIGGPDALIMADLDQPDLRARAIPTSLASPDASVLDQPLPLEPAPAIAGLDRPLRISCVSVGNPHAVAFVEAIEAIPVVGPLIERHPAFPEGVNVHLAKVVDRHHVRLATWERGAGLTLA